jgi:hypothetical protein
LRQDAEGLAADGRALAAAEDVTVVVGHLAEKGPL